MNSRRLSHVHAYKNYRYCTIKAGNIYRYLLAGINGKAIVRSGFPKALEAIRAALREAVLLSIKDP